MSAHQKTMQFLRNYAPYILWLVGLFIIIADLWLFSQLAPIRQDIGVMGKQLDGVEKQLKTIEAQHDNFVQKDTFVVLVERINHISERVDSIYSIIARKD